MLKDYPVQRSGQLAQLYMGWRPVSAGVLCTAGTVHNSDRQIAVHDCTCKQYTRLYYFYFTTGLWPGPGNIQNQFFYLQVTLYTIVHLNSTQSVEKTLKSCVYCVHWNLCTDVHTQDKYSTAESTSSQLKFEKNLRVESDKKPVDSPS